MRSRKGEKKQKKKKKEEKKEERKHAQEKIDLVNELYRPLRKKFPRRPVVVKGLGDCCQVDLIEMQDIAEFNDNYRYILGAIDIFSKMAFAVPIRNKTSLECAGVMEKILDSSKKIIGKEYKHCQTDKGNEFKSHFTAMLKRRGINHYSTFTDKKASIIERWNRTIKGH